MGESEQAMGSEIRLPPRTLFGHCFEEVQELWYACFGTAPMVHHGTRLGAVQVQVEGSQTAHEGLIMQLCVCVCGISQPPETVNQGGITSL